ncbi:MAG TPA: hypothetical protein VN605_10765, partial [Thermoanaerobaculia bacterium]|nr:hypothetical protein [Thermoanaerobaculia bacterium]
NPLMRQLLPLLLLPLATLPLLAQSSSAERTPKTPADYNRMERGVQNLQESGKSAKRLATPALKEAVKNFAPGKLPELRVTWGEFIGVDGKEFVALQFAPPVGMTLQPGRKLSAFGELLADGKWLLDYEEPASVVDSKGDAYFERSIVVDAANLTGTFGIAAGGEVLAIARVPLALEPLTKTGSGLSRLILSNNVFPLPVAQKPLDPFAFGGTKVVPKPDRAFKATDELWIFSELRNPMLDEAQTPHVTTKVELEGEGKKMRGAAQAAEALPLKGVPGHFGVGQTLDVSTLKPGEYKLRYIVTDSLAKQSWTREETLRIVE